MNNFSAFVCSVYVCIRLLGEIFHFPFVFDATSRRGFPLQFVPGSCRVACCSPLTRRTHMINPFAAVGAESTVAAVSVLSLHVSAFAHLGICLEYSRMLRTK